jgi:uncharacterized membrane protein YhfC
MENILYITHPLDGLLMIALPIGLGIFLTKKFNFGWRLWWIGAATFVLSQVGHIPFNWGLTQLFKLGLLPSPPAAWKLPFNALVLGLSAGLWEETARYAMYRWWAKDARSWRKGLMTGAGHGGMEAILLGGLVLYTFIQMLALRGADLASLVPSDQVAIVQKQIAAYWSAPWYATLLGAVERAFTIPTQIALAVLVLQAFTRRHIRWLWLAIGWHTIVDAATVYMGNFWNPYQLEGMIGLIALISVGIIFALRRPEPEEPEAMEPPAPPQPVEKIQLTPIELTHENLDETRYN